MFGFLKSNKEKYKDLNQEIEYTNEIPHSVQKTLPYIKSFEDGIFEVKLGIDSKTLQFQDINYQIARQEVKESIFLNYCSFLNYFDNNVDFQINIINSSVNQSEIEEIMLVNYTNDEFNDLREEYNDMLMTQVMKGRNDIRKDKYITVSVEANNKEQATTLLNRIEQEITQNLGKIGSTVTALDLNKRLEIFHNFHRGDEVNFDFNF